MTNSPPGKPRVAVVGAGLSGLAAAWSLAQQGFDVSVFERSAQAGGRAGGHVEEGFAVEKGLHVFAPSDRRLFSWIEELDLADEMLPVAPVTLGQVQRGAVAPISPGTPAGLAKVSGLRLRDALRTYRLPRLLSRYRAEGGLDTETPESSARWDDRSVEDFARLYFGKTAFESWVQPAINSVHPCDETQTSRVTFLLMVAAGLERGDSHAVLRRPLSRLVEAACERLDVRTGMAVERVQATASGYQLDFLGAGSEEAAAVVLATSVDEASRVGAPLLTAAERDFLLDVSFAPTVTMTLGLDGLLNGVRGLVRVPRTEGSPIDSYLLEPNAEATGPDRSARAVVVASERFALAHAGATDAVVEKALREAIGRIDARTKRRVAVAHVERAHHGVPHFQVGAYRNLARFARVQDDRRSQGRRLYFAGDYLSGPRAENALASGVRAAAAIGEDLA